MPKRKVSGDIHVRLDPDLYQALETFRQGQECPPTPPEAVRHLLRKALDKRSTSEAA
jgi:hypothetical protein